MKDIAPDHCFYEFLISYRWDLIWYYQFSSKKKLIRIQIFGWLESGYNQDLYSVHCEATLMKNTLLKRPKVILLEL